MTEEKMEAPQQNQTADQAAPQTVTMTCMRTKQKFEVPKSDISVVELGNKRRYAYVHESPYSKGTKCYKFTSRPTSSEPTNTSS